MALRKERLDILLVERNLAESRAQAQQLIMAGRILMGGEPATKPGHRVPDDAVLTLKEGRRFVSRGGEKLEAAIGHFGISVEGRLCLDVGASTGGFSDCLLHHGAARIYAVDVGKGQLHWKLRQDPRMIVMEELNARYLSRREIPESPSLGVMDVSFISLTKVMPAVIELLARESELVTLVKPQFEAGREQVGKGGVVREESVRAEVLDKIRRYGVAELGLEWVGVLESPIKGPAGNVEFLAYWRKLKS